jgi:plastocyanin
MRPRRHYLQLAIVLGAAAIVLPAVASSETTPIEAVNEPAVGPYPETHRWSPAQETVVTGAVVTFRNPTTVYHGVHWISGPTPECSNTVPVGTEPSASNINWSGTCTFKEAGTYTFYCTVHGASMSGKITVKPVGTPAATTDLPTELTQATARLNGAVNPEGNATKYRFEYGTSTVSEHMTSTLGLGSEDFSGHSVSAALTGLTPGTEYRARLVAIYGVGETAVLGGEQTFTTPVPAAPTAATGQASGLAETEATLKGTVDPNEGEATEYSFEYGATSSYGQSTKPASLPQTDRVNHAVSASLIGLAPGTEYHFRLVAHNNLGPASGVDHTFTTASPPPPSGETPSSQPPPSGTASTPGVTPSLIAFAPLAPAGPEPIGGSPLVGGAHALRLPTSQRGASVHGSIEVSSAGAGGRLEVALFAPGASLAAVRLAAAHPAGVRVGRLVRSAVHAGVVAFTVPLNVRARTALHRRHRLRVTVQIVLTPVAGAPASVTRSVVLHG